MHTLANCLSKDSSTLSKTSRNVVHSSSLGTTGKREGDKDNASIQDYNTRQAPSLARKFHNFPQNINDEFDPSDSDDCESVGSNSPAFKGANGGANKICKNQRRVCIDNASPKSPIHSNNISTRENPVNIPVEIQNIEKVFTKESVGGGNHESKSSTPISNKNSSSDMIMHEMKLGTPNNTFNERLNKNIQVGGRGNDCHGQTQQNLNKESRMGNTNYSHINTLRDSPRAQSSNAKEDNNQLIKKLDDHICLDQDDARGPSYTKNQPSKHNNINAQTSQYKDEEDHEFLDEGDGGGFDSSRHVPSRRGRLMRHGRRSRERTGGSSGGSRWESQGIYRRQSRSGSGRSNSGSTGRSQGSSRRSSRGKKGHRGKNRGGSYQSSQSGSELSCMEQYGPSTFHGHKPYPANWRCFGRRPPAIHEFRPLGEARVTNVRPAGKQGYLMRNADQKRGCQGPDVSDVWDGCYGLAKPITCQWSTPLPYGTQVIRAGNIDPFFHPSRGDLVIINPAQNFYRAMKSGYVLSYRGQDYSFGVGDLIVRLGRFMPNGEYIPYGNLELYMHTQSRDMRLLGRQPFLLVDFNYHNLDYESPGKHLAIGTFLNESFFPRRGDIIIRGGAWAENYPNVQRKHHSSVKYWRPRMEFLPNDILLRPYVDIGRKYDQSGRKFYWGAAELYTYSGKGLAWAYWGRDDHICDTPYPREQEHGIKTGHHKDEVGHYGDCGRHAHRNQAKDDCHSEHKPSRQRTQHSPHVPQRTDDCHSEHKPSPQRSQHSPRGHQRTDDCHSEHDLSRHKRS